MTINNIAIKNIKGNLNKYVMYYLSNVIVVTIFFIFANFIYNPSVSTGNISDKTIGDVASRLMYLCEFVIIIFTFIFSSYSITNFLRSREKEFGLLSMFGLTKGQIRRYVMFENIIISIVSIITGIFFGMMFSKLFFMAVSVILDLNSEIPFLISSKAVKITVASFLILLNVISFITSFKIKNNNIAELLKGERIPKETPKFSKVKSTLAIILILSGYVVGLLSKTAIILTMIPILIVVIIGTRFLFSQFSVYFTNKLQNNKNVYYKGINMITLSQIIYKLKDNAKVLFITSILSGITLASAISVYSLQKVTLSSLEENCPQDIGFIEQGINSHKVIPNGKVEDILKKYKFDIKYKNKIELIKGKNNDIMQETKKNTYGIKINKTDFNIMSQSSFNELAKQYDKKSLDLKNGQVVIYTYDLTNNIVNQKTELPFNNQKNLNLNISGKVSSFDILDNLKGGIINADTENTNTIIVSNSDFQKLWNKVSDSNKCIYYGYNIKHNLKAVSAVTEIKNEVTKSQKNFFTERVISAAGLMQILSVLLFIGTFIAMIFFIATGSILYFKMFNEIEKDKQDFVGLKKIGVTQEEIKKAVSIQSFTMFFLPLTVATLHAVFAVKSVGLLYAKYFIFIAGIYLVLQTIYYLFAKWMYVKQINSWSI
ncbi:FtsX-like permease family protein [Clostridium brassicae]|uniref:FtsX-like permease family protein n=1 Tax=Clostridium brassicae TaxID=2999072 RepID=A0ABT4DCU1_9CLOT|nr:FtsX-like permease family protein [Clostridium brassicae]MCY6960110.1 FtsX-like permease family protein [Clostridium brassicae]